MAKWAPWGEALPSGCAGRRTRTQITYPQTQLVLKQHISPELESKKVPIAAKVLGRRLACQGKCALWNGKSEVIHSMPEKINQKNKVHSEGWGALGLESMISTRKRYGCGRDCIVFSEIHSLFGLCKGRSQDVNSSLNAVHTLTLPEMTLMLHQWKSFFLVSLFGSQMVVLWYLVISKTSHDWYHVRRKNSWYWNKPSFPLNTITSPPAPRGCSYCVQHGSKWKGDI